MSQTPTRYEHYTPGLPGPEAPVERGSSYRRPASSGTPDCLVVASVVCVMIWATSGFGYFWPMWVLLPTFLPTVLPLVGRGVGRARSLSPRRREGGAAPR